MTGPAGGGDAIVIWDFNGTILDDVDLCIGILNGMLARRGLPVLDRIHYLDVFRFPIADSYRSVGFDFDRWPYKDLAAEFMNAYLPASILEIGLRAGVVEALTAFRQAGLRQVMLSASNLDDLRRQAAHFGIDRFFEEILGPSHIYGNGKADIGRGWADRQRAAATGHGPRMVMIGDTEHDCEVARAMGASCVLVEGGHNSPDRMRQSGADAVVAGIPEAAAAVLELFTLGSAPLTGV